MVERTTLPTPTAPTPHMHAEHLFAGVQTGERSRSGAVSAAATLLSHSSSRVYLFIWSDGCHDSATHSLKASRAPRRRFEQ